MIKTFEEYQEKARSTAVYPDKGNNLVYPTLGLMGEAGEFSEKVKKLIRGDRKLDDEYRTQMIYELGDIFWYISAACDELGSSMEEAATMNIQKLEDRKSRGVLKGSGDNR